MKDLFIDIQDGKILMALLEVLSGQKLVCIQGGEASVGMELCYEQRCLDSQGIRVNLVPYLGYSNKNFSNSVVISLYYRLVS